MRAVLIGEVLFSHAMFREILDSPIEIVAVCSRGGGEAGSDRVNLGPLAEAAGVDSRIVVSINELDTVSWLRSKEPDVIFCLGWSEMLRNSVLEICPGKVIGFHPSKLPQNRGRHPLIWALALGLRETASTFFSWRRDRTPDQ